METLCFDIKCDDIESLHYFIATACICWKDECSLGFRHISKYKAASSDISSAISSLPIISDDLRAARLLSWSPDACLLELDLANGGASRGRRLKDEILERLNMDPRVNMYANIRSLVFVPNRYTYEVKAIAGMTSRFFLIFLLTFIIMHALFIAVEYIWVPDTSTIAQLSIAIRLPILMLILLLGPFVPVVIVYKFAMKLTYGEAAEMCLKMILTGEFRLLQIE